MALRAGDWVEVRTKREILQTLDSTGRLDGMPFMPQMFSYCGQRFKVHRSAHKTCDPVYTGGSRHLPHAVHLDLRCDGKAYGGCQVGCLIFWKEAWLEPVRADPVERASSSSAERPLPGQITSPSGCSEEDVWRATRADSGENERNARYVCQTTQLCEFTSPLPWWNMLQYVEDYRSGNVSLADLFRGALYVWLGRPLGRRFDLARRLYDSFQAITGGLAMPIKRGTAPTGQTTPVVSLDLKPGELVRIKPHEEILATLDTRNMNRGMVFDVEMVPFCGGVYRVRSRVERFIDERTGRIKSLKTPAVILEDVWCRSRFSTCRMFCPRALHSWWREIWLERVPANENDETAPARSESPPKPGSLELDAVASGHSYSASLVRMNRCTSA
jgi:hypothetical protein